MVAFERDIDAFFSKSIQLIQVFPTARCTTKYRKVNETQSFLTVKTYDASSGAIVKYKTDKTVDLGRLLVANTKLSAALLGKSESEVKDVEMTDTAIVQQTQSGQESHGPAAEETTAASADKSKKKNKKKKAKK